MIELYWFFIWLHLPLILLIILRVDGGYLSIIELGIEDLITVFFNNLKDEFLLTCPKKWNSYCLIFGLKYILFDDILIQVAFELLFDEDLKFFKMTKFYLFFDDFLTDQLRLLRFIAYFFIHGLGKICISKVRLTLTVFQFFFLLVLLVFLDNILKLEVTIFILNEISAYIDEQVFLLGILQLANIFPDEPKVDVTDVVPLHFVLDELVDLNALGVDTA